MSFTVIFSVRKFSEKVLLLWRPQNMVTVLWQTTAFKQQNRRNRDTFEDMSSISERLVLIVGSMEILIHFIHIHYHLPECFLNLYIYFRLNKKFHTTYRVIHIYQNAEKRKFGGQTSISQKIYFITKFELVKKLSNIIKKFFCKTKFSP